MNNYFFQLVLKLIFYRSADCGCFNDLWPCPNDCDYFFQFLRSSVFKGKVNDKIVRYGD